MAGVNKVVIMGNLGRDPELSYLQNGTAKCVLAIATSYKKQDGTTVTEWHRVTAWGKQAEVIAQHFSKGSQIYIEGRLRYGQYEKDGQKIYTTDIDVREFQFCGSGKQGESQQPQQRPPQPQQQQYGNSGYDGQPMNQQQLDDDIPF